MNVNKAEKFVKIYTGKGRMTTYDQRMSDSKDFAQSSSLSDKEKKECVREFIMKGAYYTDEIRQVLWFFPWINFDKAFSDKDLKDRVKGFIVSTDRNSDKKPDKDLLISLLNITEKERQEIEFERLLYFSKVIEGGHDSLARQNKYLLSMSSLIDFIPEAREEKNTKQIKIVIQNCIEKILFKRFDLDFFEKYRQEGDMFKFGSFLLSADEIEKIVWQVLSKRPYNRYGDMDTYMRKIINADITNKIKETDSAVTIALKKSYQDQFGERGDKDKFIKQLNWIEEYLSISLGG